MAALRKRGRRRFAVAVDIRLMMRMAGGAPGLDDWRHGGGDSRARACCMAGAQKERSENHQHPAGGGDHGD